MSIREILQKYATFVKVTAALTIVILIVVILTELKGPRRFDFSNTGKEFYSDDDGKTWFLEDPLKGSPLDHGGKQAYRAMVYRCSGGRPFVAYLAEYSDEQQRRWKADAAKDPGGHTTVVGELPREIRKPGESDWKTIAPGGGYPDVKCPSDERETAVLVSPLSTDSGATE
jgi:hypothetical protein